MLILPDQIKKVVLFNFQRTLRKYDACVLIIDDVATVLLADVV